MLPVQQYIQFPQIEIDPTRNNESSLQKQAISVMQISNVHEQPSTSRKPRLNARRLGAEFSCIGKQRQREILTSLLMIMLEREKFVHFEDQIVGMGHLRAYERFRNLELISAVFRAQNALLCMKTQIAELIALKIERENAKGTEELKQSKHNVKAALEKMAVAIFGFYKNGVEYYQLLDEINSEKKNQPSEEKEGSNKKNYAPTKKEKAEKAFKISRELYEEKCKTRKLEDHQIVNYIREYIRERRFIYRIKKIFCSLSISDIQDIVRAIKIPQIETSQKPLSQEALPQEALPQEALYQEALPQEALPQEALSQEALSQEALSQEALPQEALSQEALSQKTLLQPFAQPNMQPSSTISSIDIAPSITQPSISSHLNVSLAQSFVEQQTEFKILRKPVYQDFWCSLEKKLTKGEYIRKFYQFIYTNWNNEYESEKILKKKLLKARRENDIPERCNLLLQKCFQKKLKANAIKLIYHILKIKEYQLALENLDEYDLAEKLHQQNYSINRINKLVEEGYKRVYLKYKEIEVDATTFTEKKIVELEKRFGNISRDFRLFEGYVNLHIPNNLTYISGVLNFLKEQEVVTVNIIKDLIYNDQSLFEQLNNEPNFQPKVTLGKRPFEFSQGGDLPPQTNSRYVKIGQCDSEKSNLISFESLPLMPQQKKLFFAMENSDELKLPEFQASLTSFEPELSASALEFDQAKFTQIVDNLSNFNCESATTQNTAFASKYLEYAARKVETDQRYRDIYYDLLSVDSTTISCAEMISQSVLASSFQDNQLSSQGESELNWSSEYSAGRIGAEFQPLEPISQNEIEQAAFFARNDKRQINLSKNEENENQLQGIFPEIDSQTHMSTELDIDFSDPELLNSLDYIFNDHSQQL